MYWHVISFWEVCHFRMTLKIKSIYYFYSNLYLTLKIFSLQVSLYYLNLQIRSETLQWMVTSLVLWHQAWCSFPWRRLLHIAAFQSTQPGPTHLFKTYANATLRIVKNTYLTYSGKLRNDKMSKKLSKTQKNRLQMFTRFVSKVVKYFRFSVFVKWRYGKLHGKRIRLIEESNSDLKPLPICKFIAIFLIMLFIFYNAEHI